MAGSLLGPLAAVVGGDVAMTMLKPLIAQLVGKWVCFAM